MSAPSRPKGAPRTRPHASPPSTGRSFPGAPAPGAIEQLLAGKHPDPFSVLGPHERGGHCELRVLAPGAQSVYVEFADGRTAQLSLCAEGFYAARLSGPTPKNGAAYQLRIEWPGGLQVTEDPYAFGLLLGELDLYLIAEGRHEHLSDCLGAQCLEVEGVPGVRFAVWAPNARRVSVVGGFNSWDGRRHPMRLRHGTGVWEIFIPRLQAGERYKYEIVGAHGTVLPLKADPLARQTEMPPATASMVAAARPYPWRDDVWMSSRAARQAANAPLAIYEVHAGSWLRPAADPRCVWDRLADQLIPYVREMGFTHVELLPIMEHPFGGSWGYQPLSLFAPSARYGAPEDFARFVDRCHQAEVGVILDWVPAHFPQDAHGLGQFDGTALYEYADPREGFHPDWHTAIYNLGRNEVRNFMVASALEWLRRFHVDGLRVDAVASMLYRDYSRQPGQWLPNKHGGRENLEAVDFLREMNLAVKRHFPGVITIAEESTAWPGVTAAPAGGGLGFDYKWNMGWMHDTLRYMRLDPVHRRYHHHDMTFGMIYAYSERFILPLSHDEVVHGKGSLLGKMPGDAWQRLANLRAYLAFMWTHPGKKLIFMGGELGQAVEWNHDSTLDWAVLDDPAHRGLQTLVKDLNHLYRALPELHRRDSEATGFAWLVGDDHANSVLAYLRSDGQRQVLAVCNMTPVPRLQYRIGVPRPGLWRERLNTDAAVYGGSGMGNAGSACSEEVAAHGHAQSLTLTLPPLAALVFCHEG